ERLGRTRFPSEIPGSGWDYGSNLAYLKQLVEYWRDPYDWRIPGAGLNRLPHFKTKVDRLGPPFIPQPGPGPHPIPAFPSPGSPGSVYEFMQLIPLLTDPAAHGAAGAQSFSVVAPSLPGYGFSDHTRTRAVNIQAIADIFHQLMTEVLGYPRYAAQGGDWG